MKLLKVYYYDCYQLLVFIDTHNSKSFVKTLDHLISIGKISSDQKLFDIGHIYLQNFRSKEQGYSIIFVLVFVNIF